MKKLIVNLSLVFSFILIAVFSFGQNNELLAIAETPVNTGVSNKNAVITNADVSLNEINEQLKNNLEVPDYLLGLYNTDVMVVASFLINKNGELENIHISRKSDKAYGKLLKKELGEINKVTPIKENGVVVEKYVNLPVVFKVY